MPVSMNHLVGGLMVGTYHENALKFWVGGNDFVLFLRQWGY